MSTPNEHEAILRNALHAAASSVAPGADGLDRIKGRLRTPRPLPVAWAEAIWMCLTMRAADALQSAAVATAAGLQHAWERFGPSGNTRGFRIGNRSLPSLGWLRPVAAMGTAIFIVAAGAYAAFEVPAAISPANGTSGQTANHGGHSHGISGSAARSSSQIGRFGSPRASGTPGGILSPPNCNTLSPPASGSPKPSSSPSSSQSTSSTPTPTPTPSGSATPTPTPSASTSPDTGTSTAAASAGGNSPAAPTPGNSSNAIHRLTAAVKLHRETVSARTSTSTCPPKSGKHGKATKRHRSKTATASPDAVSAAKLNDLALAGALAAAQVRIS